MSFFAKLFGRKVAAQITPEKERLHNDFLNGALADLTTLNQRAMEQHGFGSFDEWSLNQEEGILRFMDEAGQIRLETPVVIAGTYSSVSETWLWGWANTSLLPALTDPTLAIREHGTRHDIPDFTEPKISCDEAEAWAMAAVALKLIGGEGVYRGPSGSGYTFLVMGKITSHPGA
ncbi:MAG: DUF6882 domain-containing protein [Prosthecobacter sp.]